MLRIGLTGGIGSGKSTVAALFAARGIPIIDTDIIARELVQPDSPAYAEILQIFGKEIQDSSGALDRRRLRERVFDSSIERRRLEAILHPLIRAEAQQRISDLNVPYCIVVIPLLIENNFNTVIDRILVVDTQEENQIARVTARDRQEITHVRRILSAQATRNERLHRADDIIVNDTDVVHLEREVARLHNFYLSLAGPTH